MGGTDKGKTKDMLNDKTTAGGPGGYTTNNSITPLAKQDTTMVKNTVDEKSALK
jgi:hypothetical protein